MKDPADIEEFKEVRRINQAIVALLTYENSYVKYVPTSLESLQAAVETIEKDIAKLSQNYRATVQNQAILSDAKADIKRLNNLLNFSISCQKRFT